MVMVKIKYSRLFGVGMPDFSNVIIMASLNLESAFDIINRQALSVDEIHDLTELIDSFRYLRNLCTNSDNQQTIAQEISILQSTTKILFSILKFNKDGELCLQVGLQFLGNLVVNNKPNQKKVWEACRELIWNCLKFKSNKVQTYSAMILYNILLGSPELLNDVKKPLDDIIEMALLETTSEYAMFILELFIVKSDYVINFYDQLKQEHRLVILEIIKNLIVNCDNRDLKPQIIKFFSDEFIKNSDCILKTCESYTKALDPVEVVKILDLLVTFSSDDRLCYFDVIVKEISLLINSIILLRNVHFISKQKGNDFSMLTKLSEMNEIEKNASVQEHPIFGFKCSLIRLIGNLCWKNSKNQDKVRELDGISVLLDCCNFDARNPFIMQWCILAVRNMCENNAENQKVIASLSKEGKIDAARLREMGITLNTNAEGQNLCIAPLK